MLWRIRLLGGMALEREGVAPVTHFRSRKTAALLAYLTLFPGQHSRERLADLFWPDDPLPQAQQSLRVALASLRRQLEPPDLRPGSVLVATRTHIGLNPAAITSDLAELEAALEEGNPARVQALNRGPLLPDLYEDWAVLAAEALAARLESLSLVPMAVSHAHPALSAPIRRPGVPAGLDRFFGREEESAQLRALLETPGAVVTLTGFGGSGKTRLAAEIARLWPGSAVFVALADSTQAGEVTRRLAMVLTGASVPGDPLDTVVECLQHETRPLLVLDNLEQLVGTALTATVLRLREALPDARFLLTSRQRIGVPGERLVAVPTLPLPERDIPLGALARLPSIALFVDRAQACRGDFQLTLRNAQTLVDLVQALEGVPLALELAASWVGVLTPAQMRERVQDSVLALPARRIAQGRHRSLWATALWSYNLLSPELQRLFRHLSVFAGGASVAAVREVCAEPQAEEALVRLSERSLLRVLPGEPVRVLLPEALREFAAERLAEHEEGEQAGHAHAGYFVALAEQWEAALATPQQAEVLAASDREFGNLSAALAWFRAQPGDAGAEGALRLASALWRFWESRGRLAEAGAALEAALAHPGAAAFPELQARVHGGLGVVALRRGEHARAREHQEAALALRRALGEPVGIAVALYNVGMVASARGDYATAEPLYEEAIALLRPTGDTHRLSTMLMALGNLYVRREEPARGLPYLEEARTVQRESGNVMGLVYTLLALASARYGLGDLEGEARLYREALPLCCQIRDVVNGATALLNLADTLLEQGDALEQAVYFAALGEATRRQHGIALVPSDQARREKLAPLLAQPHYAALWEAGAGADWQQWDAGIPAACA